MEYKVCSFFGESRQCLPVGNTACKFVLIKNQKTVWLVFGPIDKYRYHAHLVEGLCNRLGLASVWFKKPDLVNILDKDVEIMGGGGMNFDSNENLIKFGGTSRAYGKYNRSELQNILKSHSLFKNSITKVGT